MAERLNTFVLKLLSTQEIGLRRLRSYAASIGGGALIFNDFAKIKYDLENPGPDHGQSIVLTDLSINLTDEQRKFIESKARVFVVTEANKLDFTRLNANDRLLLEHEALLRCSLQTLIDSPVIRVCMAQLCEQHHPINLANLMRWGSASTIWNAKENVQLYEAGRNFIRQYNLLQEWRRVTEMFCHFVTTQLTAMNLNIENVRFSSDGILLAIIAQCKNTDSSVVTSIAEELQIHHFPMAAINHSSHGQLEIGVFYTPFHQNEDPSSSAIVLFDKKTEEEEVEQNINIDKVG